MLWFAVWILYMLRKMKALWQEPLRFPTTTTTLLPGSMPIYSTFSYIKMVKCPCYKTKAKFLIHLINTLLSAQRHCPRNLLHCQFFSLSMYPSHWHANVVNSQTFKKNIDFTLSFSYVPSLLHNSSFYRETLTTW